MHRRATTWAVHAWIAILALLFSSLAPAAHHALTATPAQPQTTEICTSSGVKFVSLQADAPAKQSGDHVPDSLKHCGYCVAHGFPLALPPSSGTAPAMADAASLVPTLSRHAPARPFPWTVASPRAPPRLA